MEELEAQVQRDADNEPGRAVKYLCAAVMVTAALLAGVVRLSGMVRARAIEAHALTEDLAPEIDRQARADRLVRTEATKTYVLAGLAVLAGFALALLMWKRIQKARALALLAMLAVLIYGVALTWDYVFSDARADAPLGLSALSIALAASSVVSIAFLLHPSVRREFFGDLSQLAETRRAREGIWGLDAELQRREQAKRPGTSDGDGDT